MKNLFSAIAILISFASYGQKDISNINVNKTGYNSTYAVGDTITIYFKNNESALDADSVLVTWYENGDMKHYRINLGASIAPVSSGWRYVTKFIIPNNFWSPGYVKIGVDKTPTFTLAGLASVISASELALKDIEVNIYAITGHFVKTNNSQNINEGIQSGVYLFQATDNKQVYTGKFLVN
jgi:hypothetical protein